MLTLHFFYNFKKEFFMVIDINTEVLDQNTQAKKAELIQNGFDISKMNDVEIRALAIAYHQLSEFSHPNLQEYSIDSISRFKKIFNATVLETSNSILKKINNTEIINRLFADSIQPQIEITYGAYKELKKKCSQKIGELYNALITESNHSQLRTLVSDPNENFNDELKNYINT